MNPIYYLTFVSNNPDKDAEAMGYAGLFFISLVLIAAVINGIYLTINKFLNRNKEKIDMK